MWQAEDLLRQAQALEMRAIQEHGSFVEVVGVEALMRQLEACDPMIIAPLMTDVRTWAREGETRQKKRMQSWASEYQERASIVFDLRWKDGTINLAHSRVYITGVAGLDD